MLIAVQVLRASAVTRLFRALSLAGVILAPFSAQSASAAGLKTLHSFCAKKECHDGQEPKAGVVRDSAGNLYGTTSIGGKENAGVVFEISSAGKERVLHQFCQSCSGGRYPKGNLIIDTAGDLYGTTDTTVFELIPNADRSKWDFVVLRNLCPVYFECESGANGLSYQGAQSGVPYDGVSPLFGTAEFGGASGSGTVFELDFIAGKAKRKEKLLYSFCTSDNCADGAQPQATVTLDDSGNLYGTTSAGGGSNHAGVVFNLTRHKSSYSETVLYTFCQLSHCTDGGYPQSARVTLDTDGNLYGTASNGGAYNHGAVFKLEPNGTQSTYTVLYSFCPLGGSCADGSYPLAGVIVAPNGDLLGTATSGGPNGGGAIFKLQGATETVLYGFGERLDFEDGSGPVATIDLDDSGVMFGTTMGGGKVGKKTGFAGGTVWQFTP